MEQGSDQDRFLISHIGRQLVTGINTNSTTILHSKFTMLEIKMDNKLGKTIIASAEVQRGVLGIEEQITVLKTESNRQKIGRMAESVKLLVDKL